MESWSKIDNFAAFLLNFYRLEIFGGLLKALFTQTKKASLIDLFQIRNGMLFLERVLLLELDYSGCWQSCKSHELICRTLHNLRDVLTVLTRHNFVLLLETAPFDHLTITRSATEEFPKQCRFCCKIAYSVRSVNSFSTLARMKQSLLCAQTSSRIASSFLEYPPIYVLSI